RVAFRARNSVGTWGLAFAAQWLAYALPYRRFVGVLTDANARLGADVDRYSFIVVDLHHLLLAGLPAHYESYESTHSVFQNSDMMAVGKPSGDELALLEPFRGKVPDEVFGDPFVPPVSNGSGQDRALLRKASALLQEAGFVIKDGKRVRLQGEPITVEFLIDEPSFQPHHMPLIKNLGTLGIEATLRVVDPVQYRKRVDDFDFDLTIQRFAFSSPRGDSFGGYFSSRAAGMKGSQNLAGISDPVIDALIDKIIAADSRTSLTTACRVLDRVIRTGRYWVPHWYKASHWLAYWDVFGRPAAKPRYARGIP